MFAGSACFLARGEVKACLPTRRNSNLVGGGDNMKPSTENVIAGRVHEVKGKIKEKVGELTNDPDLEGEGIGEKIAGKVQKKIGQVQKVVEKP
jgi:uncharacterized protein YjbJ (UPF0337 family)